MRNHVVSKTGDGQTTLFLFDKWCEFGPLEGFISKRDFIRAGLHLQVTVCEILNNGSWR